MTAYRKFLENLALQLTSAIATLQLLALCGEKKLYA